MATTLISMAYTKAEAKAEAEKYTTPDLDSQPEYPWGLSISLEDDELSKLGMDGLPEVGAEMELLVRVKVQRASQTQMASGETERCVGLQITAMAPVDAPASDSPAAAPAPAPRPAPSRGGLLGRS